MSLLASFPHYAAFELSLIRLTSLLRSVLLVNFWWFGGQIDIVYQNSRAVCLRAHPTPCTTFARLFVALILGGRPGSRVIIYVLHVFGDDCLKKWVLRGKKRGHLLTHFPGTLFIMLIMNTSMAFFFII